MRASEILIERIKEFEGVRLEAYKCPAGVWTIGAGHTKGVRQGQIITMHQAESLLKGDLLPCETFVNGLGIGFTQGQFDALVDFAFNLGVGALRNSTLLKRIKAKDSLESIQAEFRKWVYAGGKKLPGLVKRREWESKRFAE